MTDTPKKTRRKLTFADRLAELDKRRAKLRLALDELDANRIAMLKAEREKVELLKAAVDSAQDTTG